MRVLVVEDESTLADLIRQGLRAEGLLADIAGSGEDATWMAAAIAYDVICLDVNLPGIDGFDTCRRLRDDGVSTPILMLTARDGVEDRIAGLNTGADDYLVKPFDFGELVARLRALSRRPQTRTADMLTVGDLSARHGGKISSHSSHRSGRDADLLLYMTTLEGAPVTAVKIKGAQHEFTTLPGVMEDVVDIILNIKNLVVKLEGDEPKTMKLAAMGPGEVTADLIEADPSITILNKDLVIATLTEKREFEMELRVAKGRGYVPGSEQFNTKEDQEIGLIPVDSIFSPVQRVRYKVEDTRVGQRTNYDKLTLEIWTNGTVTPEMGLVEAAKILRKHLNPFVQYFDVGADRVTEEAAAAAGVDEELIRKLNMPISELELSVRASNCLESARVETVAQLVTQSEGDLLKLRSFGRTSLREVKRKLQDLNLELGMDLPEGVNPTPAQ